MKNTKKALFTSFVSLLLCFTMLMGTTFAWFTDTANVNVTKIQAGNLDVMLYGHKVTAKSGTQVVGDEINYNDSKNAGDPLWSDADNDLWEPGFTSYRIIKILNNGNLDFDYVVDVIAKNGDSTAQYHLHDVIDVYWSKVEALPTSLARDAYKAYTSAGNLKETMAKAGTTGVMSGSLLDGEYAYYVIALHMQETADNNYQALNEEFDIVVYAKQMVSEYDSQKNTYDANSKYGTEDADGNFTERTGTTTEGGEGEGTTVNKSALITAYDNATALAETDYTPKSWAAANLATVLSEVKVVIDDAEATADDVANALDALKTATDKLVARADKTALIAKYNEATAYDNSNGMYTPDSWTALQSAIANAKTVIDNGDASEQDIADALATLTASIPPVAKADKTDLITLISSKTVAEDDKYLYTADSLETLSDAINAAQAVVDNDNASESDVTDAYNALNAVALVKNTATITVVYAGDVPEGFTAPAAETKDYGDVFIYTVSAKDNYTVSVTVNDHPYTLGPINKVVIDKINEPSYNIVVTYAKNDPTPATVNEISLDVNIPEMASEVTYKLGDVAGTYDSTTGKVTFTDLELSLTADTTLTVTAESKDANIELKTTKWYVTVTVADTDGDNILEATVDNDVKIESAYTITALNSKNGVSAGANPSDSDFANSATWYAGFSIENYEFWNYRFDLNSLNGDAYDMSINKINEIVSVATLECTVTVDNSSGISDPRFEFDSGEVIGEYTSDGAFTANISTALSNLGKTSITQFKFLQGNNATTPVVIHTVIFTVTPN